MNEIIIIGYSGHSYVLIDAIHSNGGTVKGYCDTEEKKINPFDLNYLGRESIELLSDANWIIGIGDNKLREKIQLSFIHRTNPISLIHPSVVIGSKCLIGDGVFMAANATINPLVEIGNGTIINTGAIVEHECKIGNFVHVAPGAVLAGNVEVGNRSFLGANCVVKQGVKIGSDVIVGAGTVILNDVPNHSKIVGNPGKILNKKI